MQTGFEYHPKTAPVNVPACPMHELSIAMSLIDLAGREAEQAGATQVQKVYIRVGALSGVVSEALAFAFDVASENTLLEGARLEIEEIPVTVYCPHCRSEGILSDLYAFRCPACEAPTMDIRGGRELEMTSLEIL